MSDKNEMHSAHSNGAGTHVEDGGHNTNNNLKGGSDLSRQISITLTPTQFEEMYLQPGAKSAAQTANIKAFGNPTPFGIVCFLLTYTPTMCILMGFRGTTPTSLTSLL